MGQVNCSNCACNTKEELAKQEFSLNDTQGRLSKAYESMAREKIVSPKGVAYSAANHASNNKSHEVNNFEKYTKKHINKIVKVQAWWRGNQSRKYVAFLREHQKAVTKYFTLDESRETISNDMYNPNIPREKRPKYKFKTGAIYEGEWRGGYRDGYGEQIWPDGARYIGEWKHNRAHGKGKFIHVDGDFYEGEWRNDKANGRGVYMHINGAKYDGLWKDDLQHGEGTETWTDGARYKGEYVAGKKHGHGRYQWNDGSEYDGDWVENKIYGFGVYKWLDGRSYIGEWRNNNMDGYGVYTWRDGRKYEGQYKDDKKHGFGSYTWADGRKYEGWWVTGKQHALGIYLVPSEGKEKYGIWEDGRRKEWFDETKINEINNGIHDFTQYFQNEASSTYLGKKITFIAPNDFKAKISSIKKKAEAMDI